MKLVFKHVGRYTVFMLTLAALILASPFIQETAPKAFPVIFMTSILALAGVLGINRRLWIACAILEAATISIQFMATSRGWGQFDPVYFEWLALRYGLGAGFYLLSICGILSRLFAEKHVTGDTIVGGIAVYFLIGLFWTILYHLALLLDGRAFSVALDQMGTFRLAYFSFVCLTTLGFGDIYPVSHLAQILSVLEAAAGQIYLVVFMARLIGLHTSWHGEK